MTGTRMLPASLLLPLILALACTAPAAPPPSGGPAPAMQGGPAAAGPATFTPVALKVGYPTLGAGRADLWVPKEAGLFDKYGLDVELVYLAGGPKLIQTLISKDIDIALSNSDAIVSANLQGANLTMLASSTNIAVLSLYSTTDIQRVEDLRGRAAAVTQVGSSGDIALRAVLRQHGLEPDRDAGIIQIGGQPEIFAALANGAIQAAIFSPPNNFRAAKEGYRELVDITALRLPNLGGAVAVHRDDVERRPEVFRRFVQAYVEGIAHAKKEKAFAKGVIKKYTQQDDDLIIDQTYDLYVTRVFERIPRIVKEGVEEGLVRIKELNPSAASARPESFYDNRFVEELERSGFIDALYK